MSSSNTLDQRRIYQEKVQAEFEKLNAQIDEYRAKASQAQADAKIQYQNQLEKLSAKQAAAEQKLKELQASSEDAWQEIQLGFENAWNDLKGAFSEAVSKFE